ncbi:MAG: Zn-ribbon domain-containing OB-fold protein [Fidelibacterota bacterium]
MSSENRGTVKVINGRYRLEGKFHFVYPNTPIRNEAGHLTGVTNPRDITHIHMYGGEAPFFENLSKGKLLGTKCVNQNCSGQGTIYIPFRIHCPDCLDKNEIIDMTTLAKTKARVHTFMITERTGAFNTLPKPVRFVNVEFEGVSTILMGNLAVGTPKIGMQVVPIFQKEKPTYTILDLAWVPAGTGSEYLPSGFTLD